MAKFNERLRNLREDKRLTQKDIANKFKLAESTISMYERGEREPSFDFIKQIASFFDVTTDYLLGRSDFIYEEKADYISEKNKQFIFDLNMSDEELMEKYKFVDEEKEYTDEEFKAMLQVIRSALALSHKKK